MSLTGCGVQIDVYEQQNDDGWYFGVDLRVKESLCGELEDSAAYSEKRNKPWTIEDWLCDYFSLMSESYGFSYNYDGVYRDSNASAYKIYRFSVYADKRKIREELKDGLTLDGELEQKSNLFVRTINVVRDDRFNWWVREFEGAYERFDSGKPEPMDNQTLMGIILFGCGSYEYDSEIDDTVYKEELPGFSDAFTAAQMNEYTKVLLRDFWYASRKMNVNYDDVVGLRSSDGEIDDKNVYYVFEKQVGEGPTAVEYEYYRADPTGWYIVALAFGGLVVGITILIARNIDRKKKKQPKTQVKDLFPYDPFGGDIDPFA